MLRLKELHLKTYLHSDNVTSGFRKIVKSDNKIALENIVYNFPESKFNGVETMALVPNNERLLRRTWSMK